MRDHVNNHQPNRFDTDKLKYRAPWSVKVAKKLLKTDTGAGREGAQELSWLLGQCQKVSSVGLCRQEIELSGNHDSSSKICCAAEERVKMSEQLKC
jgi:hypothetical protein